MISEGKIIPFWTEEFKEFDYVRSPFNNIDDINLWKKQGFLIKDVIGEIFSIFEKRQIQWVDNFFELFRGSNIGINFYKMQPGDILPYHSDTYIKFKKVHNLHENTTINRALVFLEDRKEGHIFEVDGKLINWKAGDYIIWSNDVRHMAANIGTEPRYTVQITFTDV